MNPVYATFTIAERRLRQMLGAAPKFMVVGQRPSAMNRIWPTNKQGAFSNG
jgi:hypothetical protein